VSTSKTVFIDIDGTILKHPGNLSNLHHQDPTVLPNVIKKLDEWSYKGYRIIVTTARPESMKKFTVWQLRKANIFYNDLIMGIPHGSRVIINDKKPNGNVSAEAYSVERDAGLGSVEI